MLTGGNTHAFQLFVLTSFAAVGVLAAGRGAQENMFSGGDRYERFMGRWSRRIAPLFVDFAALPG